MASSDMHLLLDDAAAAPPDPTVIEGETGETIEGESGVEIKGEQTP